MKRLGTLLLAVVMVVLCLGPGAATAAAAQQAKPTKIALNATKKTLYTGELFQLSVKSVRPAGAKAGVKWTSDRNDVVSVSAKGLARAKGVGTAKITATSTANPQVKATAILRVRQGVRNKSMALSAKKHTLEQGGTVTLSVQKWNPKNTKVKKVTWASSSHAVARVSASGKVTAVGLGKAKITATNTYGKRASCTITVVPPATLPPDASSEPTDASQLPDTSSQPPDASSQPPTEEPPSSSSSPPETDPHTVSFRVSVYSLDGRRLPGETFALYQAGVPVHTATTPTDDDTFLIFDTVAAGTYTLQQVAVLPGHKPYGQTHTVVVEQGVATVDGAPANPFHLQYQVGSDAPTINPARPTDKAITGRGVPGAAIHMTVSNTHGPNTAAFYNTTVGQDGTWFVEINRDYMTEYRGFYVSQTEPGYKKSVYVNGQVRTPSTTLQFRVVDGVSGESVPGVSIKVTYPSGYAPSSISDENGAFTLYHGPGAYPLSYEDKKAPYTRSSIDGKALVINDDDTVFIGEEAVTGVYIIRLYA